MPIIPLPLGTQSNPGRFPGAGSARLVNCYMEPAGAEGKTQVPIYAAPGLVTWAAAGGGGVRAMLATSSYLYVVRGRLLSRFDPSGTETFIGGIPTDGPVTMARNRREPEPEIGIVSDGTYWVCTGATLAESDDTDLPPSSSIDVLDGYGILPGYGGTWYITGVDDFTAIDALDFASAESKPDNIVRVAVRESEAVFFGVDSTEWWQNTGAEAFPFSRVQTAGIGCLAAGGVARLDRTLVWVANDFTVRQMEGYGGRVISTTAVSRDIEADAARGDLKATAWTSGGYWFYSLTGSTWTWQYRLHMASGDGRWFNRESYGQSTWRISQVVSFAGKVIAGDATTGALYELRDTAHDEAGEPLVISATTGIAHEFPSRLAIDTLYVDVIAGEGLVPGADGTTDPQLMIAMSRDGGATFGPERQVSMGVRGARTKRIKSNRWGTVGTAGAAFRLTASAAVARGFLGAALDASKLPA